MSETATYRVPGMSCDGLASRDAEVAAEKSGELLEAVDRSARAR